MQRYIAPPTPIRTARTALLRAVDELRLAAVIADDGATLTVHHCPRSRRAVLARVPATSGGFPVVLASTPERERRRIAAENGRRP